MRAIVRTCFPAWLLILAVAAGATSGDRDGGGPWPVTALRPCYTEPMVPEESARGDYLDVARSATGEIPILFQILRDSNGEGGFEPRDSSEIADELDSVVTHLNTLFPESPDSEHRPLRFFVYGVLDGKAEPSLRSNDLLELVDGEINDIRAWHSFPGLINVFLVDRITIGDEGYCGVASLPASSVQGIVMNWRCLYLFGGFSTTLAHEIGHYFYLYHPHSDFFFGEELVGRDPSNCRYRGDRLCDTPADPELGYDNVDSLTCAYMGDKRDSEGVPYEPDVTNIMSYAPKHCRSSFSPGQLARMHKALDHELIGRVGTEAPSGVAVRAYPNPITASTPFTAVHFRLPLVRMEASVAVYDVRGRKVRTLLAGPVDGLDPADGVAWDGTNERGEIVARGIYFIGVHLRWETGQADSDGDPITETVHGGTRVLVLR